MSEDWAELGHMAAFMLEYIEYETKDLAQARRDLVIAIQKYPQYRPAILRDGRVSPPDYLICPLDVAERSAADDRMTLMEGEHE